MQNYIHFGEFRVQINQLKSLEEAPDGGFLLRYAADACILLYDLAADEALEWFKKNAAHAILRRNNMSRKVYADKGRVEFGQGIEPAQSRQESQGLPHNTQRVLKNFTLKAIGTPDDLLDVDVKELHDQNHFRVNVYREIKAVRKMTDSFYVVVTDHGIISLPDMVKTYYDADLRLISANNS